MATLYVDHQKQGHASSSSNGVVGYAGNPNNGSLAPENSGSLDAARGILPDWTQDEQLILEEGLSRYASYPSLVCYAKIATHLEDKTVRDVALRCRWMTKIENSKRKKEDHNVTRKGKDKKERHSIKLSHLASRHSVPPYARPMFPMDGDDGFSYEVIGGPMGLLLQQNAQAFNQISANFTSHQYQENINLFCQARHNIISILNNLNDMPELMKRMPPLPEKLNEELATAILGRPSIPMQ